MNMSSPPTLESLPFDILFPIAAYLDIREYMHLGYLSRSMRSSMENIAIARATIKVSNNEGESKN